MVCMEARTGQAVHSERRNISCMSFGLSRAGAASSFLAAGIVLLEQRNLARLDQHLYSINLVEESRICLCLPL
jgi:hypothetical protein